MKLQEARKLATEVDDETKCIEMLYYDVLHSRKITIITPYRLHNHLLLHVNHYKYLGIIIHSDLK